MFGGDCILIGLYFFDVFLRRGTVTSKMILDDSVLMFGGDCILIGLYFFEVFVRRGTVTSKMILIDSV